VTCPGILGPIETRQVSTQTSHATPNESFTFGFFINVDIGSLTGTLIAGHDYRFFHDFGIVSSPTAPVSGATASGFTSLHLSVIPEPSTALLLGLGLFGLGARR
jgi:hypothetical protein